MLRVHDLSPTGMDRLESFVMRCFKQAYQTQFLVSRQFRKDLIEHLLSTVQDQINDTHCIWTPEASFMKQAGVLRLDYEELIIENTQVA